MKTLCPKCREEGAIGEDATPDEPARAPKIGDIVFCPNCVAVLIIWKDGSLQELNDELQTVLPHRTREMIAAIKRRAMN